MALIQVGENSNEGEIEGGRGKFRSGFCHFRHVPAGNGAERNIIDNIDSKRI